jgi:transaldolase
MAITEVSRLVQLFRNEGQSPWLDNLRREYLTSGELRELINLGVRGLTSNPTIFQKAIQGSSAYDQQFAELMTDGLSLTEIYWELVLSDIRRASELFQETYAESDGVDGYVSVEVDPHLAHDAEGTLSAARELDDRIEANNVMIKIPATKECIPVIKTMISESRNVNVTLIFSLNRYSEVVEAYISGLEDLARNPKASLGQVASVASFFISRVDSEVDAQLAVINTPESLHLRGLAAIAQAKLAYEIFEKAFTGPRWMALQERGAKVQRPLWASTSTKDPAYADTLYVDELVGPNSVNTLPENTLHFFNDHGTVSRTITKDLATAHSTWESLQKIGVSMDAVAQKLESEGVASFQKSFDELLATLAEKQKSLSKASQDHDGL